MNSLKKTVLAVSAVLLLVVGTTEAKVLLKETRRHAVDPETHASLRSEMTSMETQFLKLRIMASQDAIDYKAIQDALKDMDDSSQKIRKINTNEELRDPLKELDGQISKIRRDAKRKDPAALKTGLDHLFQTCFQCHQAHAPLM